MKRIALLLLVIALAFTLFVFTGCGGGDVDTDTDSENVNTDTNTDTDSSTQKPGADEDLQAAYEYIKLTYKTLSTTSSNFELMKNAPIGDKNFEITWSTDNEAITITETEDGNFYVVNVPALGDAAVNYKLKFSIQNEAGEKKEGEFSLTVPKYAVNTFEEYVAAEDGTPLIIQGIVTGVISKSTNSSKENSLFIQDLNGNGGYYAYNLAEDPNGTISVGMTVEVRGNKKNYNGTFELTSPVATVIDSTIKTVTPVDFTATLAGASSLDAAELTGKNGMLVTIKGVTMLEYVEGNGYHYFQLGNHKTYLRVSSSSNCITKDEGATLTSNFQKNFYNSADVTGIIAVYNNDFYLMPVSSNAFTNIVELEKPADVKVDTALSNTKLPSIIQIAGDTNLPTSFSGFSDVTIAWELISVAGVDCATLNSNVLTVTIPTAAQVVKLKATATCGDVSNSKEFEITVKAISTISIQEANNIGMNMAHNTYTEELYYIVGTVDSIADTFHGNMFITEGAFSVYIYGLYDATGAVKYGNMEVKPLVKDTIKVLSSVGKYSNDVQLKNAKVIEHTVHPDNEGVVDEYTQMTITEALSAEDNTMVKVSGTVVSIDTVWNEQFGNICVTIADADGNKLYVYRLATKVEVGDIITVKGTITTYNEKKQIAQGGTATIDGHDSSYDYVEMTITEALAAADGTNVIVVGTVSKIDKPYDSNYKNISVYIVDEDGNELYLYRLSGDVAVGKTIKVKGSMTTYSGNRQLVGGTYVEVTGSGDTDDTCEEHLYINGVCDKCGAKDPDYVATMTITEALAAADNTKVTVTGIVIKINTPYDEGYGNITVTIADGSGDTLYLYRLTGNFSVNDIITVTGTMSTYSGARQIAQGGTATKNGTHTCSQYTEATCKELAKCTECGTTTGELGEHNYVEGVCSVCGHNESEPDVKYAIEKFEIAANTGSLSGDSLSISWVSDNFNFVGEKASSQNAIRTSDSDHFRMYQGSKFTITGKNGQKIQSMVVKCTSSDYATALASSLTTAGVTAVANGTSVTFTADTTVTSIEFSLTKQSRVQYFDITYVVE